MSGTAPEMHGFSRAHVDKVPRLPSEAGLVAPVAGQTTSGQSSAVSPSGIPSLVRKHLVKGHGPSRVSPYLMMIDGCGNIKAQASPLTGDECEGPLQLQP